MNSKICACSSEARTLYRKRAGSTVTLLALAALSGCSTTTSLGRIDDRLDASNDGEGHDSADARDAVDDARSMGDVASDSAVGVPAWLDAMPMGAWSELANTRIVDTMTSAGRVGVGIFHDQSGLALKRDDSSLIAFGGGYAGYNGNEVVVLRLTDNVPRWEVWVEPSPIAERVQARSGEPTPPLWWGPIGAQRPNPPNTYGSAQFSVSAGRALWYGQFAPWSYSGAPPGGNEVLSVLWSERRWAQPSTAEAYGVIPRGGGRVTIQDDDGLVYVASGQTVQRHDPVTNAWTMVASDPSLRWAGFGSMAFDARRRQLFRFGDAYGDASGNPRVIALDGAVSTPTFTGDAATVAALRALAQLDTLGMTYDATHDRFVLPTGQGGDCFVIDAQTWAVTVLRPGGAVPADKPRASVGVYARVHYVPQLRVIVYAPNAAANVMVLRL